MIIWKHIMNEQPEDGQMIVQLDVPYRRHYNIGMRPYVQKCSWEEILHLYNTTGQGHPDFWWILADDFPFPDTTCEKKEVPRDAFGRCYDPICFHAWNGCGNIKI